MPQPTQGDAPDSKPDPQPKPRPKAQGEDNLRVKRRPCRVGKYKDIKDTCGPGYQAHHIVPDYTLRYGTRAQGSASPPMFRIPSNAPGFDQPPSLDDGPAICLEGNAKDTGTEHSEAHGADGLIAAMGAMSPIPGTAPMSAIQDLATLQTIQVRPECKEQILAAVHDGFGKTDPDLLGRTTTSPPKVGSDAYNALSTGARSGS